jgi:hypothetical protein
MYLIVLLTLPCSQHNSIRNAASSPHSFRSIRGMCRVLMTPAHVTKSHCKPEMKQAIFVEACAQIRAVRHVGGRQCEQKAEPPTTLGRVCGGCEVEHTSKCGCWEAFLKISNPRQQPMIRQL